MMRFLCNAPLKRKLTAITLLTSVVALLLAYLAYMTHEVRSFKSTMVRDLSRTAAVVGSGSASALAFDDVVSAAQTLRSLNTHPQIVGAALYDEKGEIFAQYSAALPGKVFEPPPLAASGHRFGEEGLGLFLRIDLAGEPVGTLYVQADLQDLRARLEQYALIGLIVLVFSSLIAVLLATRLQAAITGPISHLAGVMGAVRASNDYSLRAAKRHDDELGRLIDGFNAMLDHIRAQDAALQESRERLEQRVAARTCELEQQVVERERAQTALQKTHMQLVEISRQAGMAEVATSVLHNVGNVLNSVNVSADLIGRRIEGSKIVGLPRLVAMLAGEAPQLGRFITEDPRGRHVPAYLSELSRHLMAEREALLKELTELCGNVDHIKHIVSMQQSYAKVSGLKEIVSLVELAEDALRMSDGALKRHGVGIVREYAEVQTINSEKHKILQILVNLVRNAKHACIETGLPERWVRLQVTSEDGWVRAAVSDNGVGIAPQDMTRIFAYGFTTRPEGHGFGLHSGALAARELGGSLRAYSDGPGQGATFVLELPLVSAEAAAA